MKEKYFSIKEEIHVKQKVGACRFFGSARPVHTEEQANSFIDEVKEKFPNASHYVYAYVISDSDNPIVKYSDDGEPANSSGPPVLQSIETRDLTNVIVVITRYYGGVNQGFGGLIRAYGSTASLALENCTITEYELFQRIKVKPVEYSQLGDIIHFVESFGGSITDIEYGADVIVLAELKNDVLDKFKIKVRDITKGRGQLVLGEQIWKRKK
jgi:uncharacterized YigZ family protein